MAEKDDEGPSEKAKRNVKLSLLELITNDGDIKTAFAKLISETVDEMPTSHPELMVQQRAVPAAYGPVDMDADLAASVLSLIREVFRQHLRPEVLRKPL